MKKLRTVYYFISLVLVTGALFCVFCGGVIQVGALLCFFLLAWWREYFRALRYTLDKEKLYIKSGLLLQRRREIPLCCIIWTTSLILPFSRRAFATVLHTAGGKIVIFAEYSTQR